MKVFIRTHRLLPLATFVLLSVLVAVTLVSPLVQVQWGGTNGMRLMLGGLGGNALASGTWTSQTSSTTQNLNGLACPGTTTCFAVGASGTILNTIDGSSWSSQTSGTTNNLNSIACPDATTCFAVGNSGTILNNAGSLTESGATAGSATPVTLNGVNRTTIYTLAFTVSD